VRAIVSVSSKEGVSEFAKGLIALGFDVYSTGGTKKGLTEAGVKVHSVSDITGFPEILDGRVKTLHPAVHGGLLAKRNLPAHMQELSRQKIEPIDLVAVNLYPFVQTVSKDGVTLDDALENIDIGGPTMIRAAAKNFPAVVVVVDPADYQIVLDGLQKGSLDLEQRKRLAQKAFQHVAMYDTAISQYLGQGTMFPENMTIALKKVAELRYGENPHQKGAFYAEQAVGVKFSGMAGLKQLHGPELSFNNYLDLDGAVNAVKDFTLPTVAIIKHTNSCGLSSHKDLTEAYKRALSGDPIAAFGGVISFNVPVTYEAAVEVDKTHYDAMIAPDYDPRALELFKKKKNLRVIALPTLTDSNKLQSQTMDIRRVNGGLLLQTYDTFQDVEWKPKVMSKRAPTAKELEDLFFAWRAVKNIKSNAIVIAKDQTLLGMGAGQPSRVVSAQLAVNKAGDAAKGAVVGSDAFFPFPDGVELLAKAGVTAIMEPGGSVKDTDAVAVCDKYNIAMVFTGHRHFRH